MATLVWVMTFPSSAQWEVTSGTGGDIAQWDRSQVDMDIGNLQSCAGQSISFPTVTSLTALVLPT